MKPVLRIQDTVRDGKWNQEIRLARARLQRATKQTYNFTNNCSEHRTERFLLTNPTPLGRRLLLQRLQRLQLPTLLHCQCRTRVGVYVSSARFVPATVLRRLNRLPCQFVSEIRRQTHKRKTTKKGERKKKTPKPNQTNMRMWIPPKFQTLHGTKMAFEFFLKRAQATGMMKDFSNSISIKRQSYLSPSKVRQKEQAVLKKQRTTRALTDCLREILVKRRYVVCCGHCAVQQLSHMSHMGLCCALSRV